MTSALQELTEANRDLILPWLNTPKVRRQMDIRRPISPEEYCAWFEHIHNDPSQRWYLYHDDNGEPAGVVYYTDIESAGNTAFWGYFARPEAPAGREKRVLHAALEYAFNELNLHKLNVEVLATNAASVHTQEKYGFTREGIFREQHFDGEQHVDVIRLSLLAAEWPEHRERLRERIAHLDALAARREEEKAPPPRKIEILSDANSWINEMVPDLIEEWDALGHQLAWHHAPREAEPADLCFCLGFSEVLPANIRSQFDHTLVVHESDLPQGKGWSPLTWQVLEGKNRIPVTLIEAADRVDSGSIYAQRWLEFQGHELVDELRADQAEATRAICRWFVDEYPESVAQARPQKGDESFYPRRRPTDSWLDPNKTLAEQFELLRVVDNERYPLLFEFRQTKYRLCVFKADRTVRTQT